ncbi:InlB B-repeat-containing protein, partial [Holdemanella sp.]|uniref:InlB B-repeat-containing protein n=1 Tax=Holdemanella sp. TaxID=1971762 RepID=UPI003AEFC945
WKLVDSQEGICCPEESGLFSGKIKCYIYYGRYEGSHIDECKEKYGDLYLSYDTSNNSCTVNAIYATAVSHCYVCDTTGQYQWATSKPSTSCSGGGWYEKTSITTAANCVAPTYSCWKCDADNKYVWASSQPSSTCTGGNWYKSNTITSAANCKAPTYSCWRCDVGNQYVWSSSQPSTTCSGGSWYKSNTITSAANCKAPTTTYTATFYANGGTFSDGSTTWTKKIYSGERNYFSQMEIPTLTLSGCTADGWYMTNASGTVYRQYFDTGDATKFYAHWNCSSSGGETGGGETPTPTTYTVKYDANGGTGAPSNQTKKQGESLTISTAKPTKTGYTFTSWNTKKDGTGTKYDIGASYTVDAELTLYAQYKENTVTYAVKYDANGGENAPKEQTKTKGKELVLSTTVPTKEGYKFVNWNTKKDGTGTSYNAGSKYTTEASVTLYAQYEKELNEEETKYTITFYTNDGTTEKSTKVVNKGDKVVKPEDPTREGYTFDGWYDKKENGKEYDFTKEVTSDISLYAYWSKIGDKTNEDVDKNSKTGDILIFIAWTAGIGALTYSVYYFKSRKETI